MNVLNLWEIVESKPASELAFKDYGE